MNKKFFLSYDESDSVYILNSYYPESEFMNSQSLTKFKVVKEGEEKS